MLLKACGGKQAWWFGGEGWLDEYPQIEVYRHSGGLCFLVLPFLQLQGEGGRRPSPGHLPHVSGPTVIFFICSIVVSTIVFLNVPLEAQHSPVQ